MKEDLAKIVGHDHVSAPEAAVADIAGYDLGTPGAIVSPANAVEIVDVIGWARAHRVPLVPMGRRTAYWRPLDLGGAVAVDLSRMDAIAIFDGAVWCGAGIAVRRLDIALRKAGYYLPIHPDAFGDTSVGAMVASACTSGIGMAEGSISRWLTGVEVVTGRGDRFQTGSAALHGVTSFLRDGLPDPTGLFVGAEGALGIVTGVGLALRPAPWRVRVSCAAEPRSLVAAAREFATAYDTFRAVKASDGAGGYEVDVFVVSPISAAEAADRATLIARRLGVDAVIAPESDAARAGIEPAYGARWNGPEAEHAQFAARALLVGMDVNVAYAAFDAVLRVADAAFEEAKSVGPARTAVYFAPDFVNVGMHATVPHARRAWSHAHVRKWLGLLSDLAVVPYRLGRTWPSGMRDRIDPTFRRLLREMKTTLDPEGILCPGNALFAEVPP